LFGARLCPGGHLCEEERFLLYVSYSH
jgi:hypothetical protein